MLRRALIHRLNGYQYAEMPPGQILEMSVAELMKALNVRVDKQGLRVCAMTPTALNPEARARQFAHMFPGGYGYGSRSKVAKAQGKPMNSKIYGYHVDKKGRYIPDTRMAIFIRNGFEIAKENGYTDAGRYLNQVGVRTPMGGIWSKDTARDFFRNPVYAGYIREFTERKKRGASALYPAWQVVPLITLADWITVNYRYVLTQQISFPSGFLNSRDRQAWEEIVIHNRDWSLREAV
jgi:hypothetical protein